MGPSRRVWFPFIDSLTKEGARGRLQLSRLYLPDPSKGNLTGYVTAIMKRSPNVSVRATIPALAGIAPEAQIHVVGKAQKYREDSGCDLCGRPGVMGCKIVLDLHGPSSSANNAHPSESQGIAEHLSAGHPA